MYPSPSQHTWRMTVHVERALQAKQSLSTECTPVVLLCMYALSPKVNIRWDLRFIITLGVYSGRCTRDCVINNTDNAYNRVVMNIHESSDLQISAQIHLQLMLNLFLIVKLSSRKPAWGHWKLWSKLQACIDETTLKMW